MTLREPSSTPTPPVEADAGTVSAAEVATALAALTQDSTLTQALAEALDLAARLQLLALGLARQGLAVSPARIACWLGLPGVPLGEDDLASVAGGVLNAEVVDAVTQTNLKRPEDGQSGGSLPNPAYLTQLANLVGLKGAGWGRIGAEW